MANLKQLKLKRQSVDKTRKVTRAMEAVSAVKMRKSQELALSGRSFALVALRILNAIASDWDSVKHPLVASKNDGARGLLLVTSDKGLAGSLNSAVLKKAQAFLDEHANDKIVAVAIGRRAREFLKARSVDILLEMDNNKDAVDLSDTEKISEIISKVQTNAETSTWTVAYMNFVSTFEQNPVLRQILPLEKAELENLAFEIAPTKGKFSDEAVKQEDIKRRSYLIEADSESILNDLIFELLNIFVHHTLLESKASEHSARMVAMKAATDKAGEMSHELLLKFNKARQAAITREVSEITSGVEAMKE